MTPPIPAIPAIQPIMPIPAIPPLPQYTGDHDLLVALDTRVKDLKDSVDKLVAREETHVTKELLNLNVAESKKVHEDHETRIRAGELSITRIQTWGAAVIVALTIGQFVVNHLWK